MVDPVVCRDPAVCERTFWPLASVAGMRQRLKPEPEALVCAKAVSADATDIGLGQVPGALPRGVWIKKSSG